MDPFGKTGPVMDSIRPEERLILMDVIDALAAVRAADQLLTCTNGKLQRLLPHERLACIVAGFNDERVQLYGMLLHEFPHQYIEELRRADGAPDCSVMQRWRIQRRPLLVDQAHDVAGATTAYQRIVKYGLKNIAMHGFSDVQGDLTSYFCFADIPEQLGPRHASLLRILTPYLHVALMCAIPVLENLQLSTANMYDALTDLQKEILRWIYLGKTNWEIGRILDMSEDSVKYQVALILDKLHAENRAQAVVNALSTGVIKP